MKIRSKLKSRAGFSLAETLLATLILLLVSLIVANGIPTARTVYNNVIIGANAQTLLSTAVSSLRNELGAAQRVQVDASGNIFYYKPATGAYAVISPSKATMTGISPETIDPPDTDARMDGIQQLDYVTQVTGGWKAIPDGETTKRQSHYLVSVAAANKNLKVTYGSADYNASQPDIIAINNITVSRAVGETTVIASLDKLVIRLSPISD